MALQEQAIPAFLAKESNILTEAEDTVFGNREKIYGHPSKNLRAIAILWSAHLRAKYGILTELTAEDVCWMMVQLKSARAMNTYTRDNQVDAAGYVALVERIREPLRERQNIVQGGIAPITADKLQNVGG